MPKEIIIAKVTDLQDGEMKEVEVDGLKILLTRLDGTFYALQNGQVMAAAGCEYDHGMAYIAELMRNGLMPTPAQLRSGAADLLGHLK